MTTSLPESDLASMTIRELLAELARLEDSLHDRRSDASRAKYETADIQRRMSAISACLRARREAPERLAT